MKKWYQSQTIVSTLLLAVALGKSLLGVDLISNDEIQTIGTSIETIITWVIGLITLATAIYGRFKAKDKVSL